MSYLLQLNNLQAVNLWCGRASLEECLVALLYSIEKNNCVSFPNHDNLKELLEFIRIDTKKYSPRMKSLEAPKGTERIPLIQVNISLLVKLIVFRLKIIADKYLELTKFKNIFNNDYINKTKMIQY